MFTLWKKSSSVNMPERRRSQCLMYQGKKDKLDTGRQLREDSEERNIGDNKRDLRLTDDPAITGAGATAEVKSPHLGCSLYSK